MDIISMIQTLQNSAPQIVNSYCIVNGALMSLDEIQTMGYDKFCLRSKLNMPPKLYKYFPNKNVELKDEVSGEPFFDEKTQKNRTVNYSIQALRDNTVYMQTPSLFDDVYDSDISLNFKEYEKARLMEYCIRCEISISDKTTSHEMGNALLQAIIKSFNETGNFASVFKKKPGSEIEELSNKNFSLQLENEIIKNGAWGTALANVIISDFKGYSQYLKSTFRASCFATTPYSQLMWGGSYADSHKGFCVEYTMVPNDSQYAALYHNLFPLIYCKIRPDMTERLTKFEDKEPTKELLWDIYFHGMLRKSIDWAFQNEWRLLLPMEKNQPSRNYSVPFYPITKVFLGNRMPNTEREKIIDICHERNIPYVGVTRNPNVFEMQDCTIKCEDCSSYLENA